MSISNRQREEREIRKERIISGALEVFKKHGIKNSTMEQIASESDFGKATLYYYFQSKEEVFCHILEDGWENLWASVETVINSHESPRKTFIETLLVIAKHIRKKPALYEFLFNAPQKVSFKERPWEKFQKRMYSALQSLLKEGIKKGEFPAINPGLLFKAMGGLFLGLVLMGDKKESISEAKIEDLINQLIIEPSN
tara:strand:+ start:273 stop:863 length:591 start_codon:yes stop_codon:yes gene_type:complete